MRYAIACLLLTVPCAVWAADEGPRTPLSVEAGFGFTADPDSFLLSVALPWEITDEISVGPLVQFGLDDDFIIIAPTMNARYAFDFSTSDPSELRRVRPSIEFGAGFAYAKLDGLPSFIDDDDIEFMMNFGLGVDYQLSRSWAIGSRMRFNVIPGDLFGENLIYSWEVAGLRFQF